MQEDTGDVAVEGGATGAGSKGVDYYLGVVRGRIARDV